ncbi:MAG: protocatechuate 3,4-dioxygenase subunit alpha [Pseudomonadota bacterium]
MDHSAVLPETPSQTAGPYLHIGLAPEGAGIRPWSAPTAAASPIGPATPGRHLRLLLELLDGQGAPLHDALIEIWQADATGRHAPKTNAPEFTGFARLLPDPAGAFTLQTIRPGTVEGQAPHLTLWIIARGLNLGLHTRVYFPEDAALFGDDPVLSRIERPERRATLIAGAMGQDAYRHRIHLQGDRETVFLDI